MLFKCSGLDEFLDVENRLQQRSEKAHPFCMFVSEATAEGLAVSRRHVKTMLLETLAAGLGAGTLTTNQQYCTVPWDGPAGTVILLIFHLGLLLLLPPASQQWWCQGYEPPAPGREPCACSQAVQKAQELAVVTCPSMGSGSLPQLLLP